MRKSFSLLATALMSSLVLATEATADDFYKGKTITVVQIVDAEGKGGGGFDTYARAIARHMAKHIPG